MARDFIIGDIVYHQKQDRSGKVSALSDTQCFVNWYVGSKGRPRDSWVRKTSICCDVEQFKVGDKVQDKDGNIGTFIVARDEKKVPKRTKKNPSHYVVIRWDDNKKNNKSIQNFYDPEVKKILSDYADTIKKSDKEIIYYDSYSLKNIDLFPYPVVPENIKTTKPENMIQPISTETNTSDIKIGDRIIWSREITGKVVAFVKKDAPYPFVNSDPRAIMWLDKLSTGGGYSYHKLLELKAIDPNPELQAEILAAGHKETDNLFYAPDIIHCRKTNTKKANIAASPVKDLPQKEEIKIRDYVKIYYTPSFAEGRVVSIGATPDTFVIILNKEAADSWSYNSLIAAGEINQDVKLLQEIYSKGYTADSRIFLRPAKSNCEKSTLPNIVENKVQLKIGDRIKNCLGEPGTIVDFTNDGLVIMMTDHQLKPHQGFTYSTLVGGGRAKLNTNVVRALWNHGYDVDSRVFLIPPASNCEKIEQPIKDQAQGSIPAETKERKTYNKEGAAKAFNKGYVSPFIKWSDIVPPESSTTFRSNLKEAGYRITATQLTNASRASIIALLHSQNITTTHLEPFLNSELGSSVLAMLLGLGMTQLPQHDSLEFVEKLAKEFRIHSMTTLGNAAVEEFVQYISQSITQSLTADNQQSVPLSPLMEEEEEYHQNIAEG